MREYTAAISGLEEEINKAFDAFKGRVSISCSEFLEELDVTPINTHIFKTYRGEEWRFRHNPTFMLKATVFMKLKGIKFQVGLIKHLKRNQKDALNLGYRLGSGRKAMLPSRRAFNHFMNERLTKEIWGLIDFIVEYSKETATRRGILLNFATAEKPRKKQSDRTLFRKKKRKTHELYKLMRKNIYPKIGMDLAHNTVFKRNDFLDMLTHVALTHDFTENGSWTFAYQKGERTPSADTLLYHLKKYRHRKVLEGVYDEVFEMVIAMAKKSGFLQRPLDLAIDMTDILYYGDESDYMVVGTKPQKGTTYAFKFATVNAVVNGERFILNAIPVGPSMKPHDVVARLMVSVRGKVKVRRVYLDRGFYGRKVIGYFNRNNIKFVMPARRDDRIKSIMDKHKAPYVMLYKLRNKKGNTTEWFNLAIVKGGKRGDKDKKYVFATNMEITGNTAFLALGGYDKRWGIETSYRVKEVFRARTTSKNYLIRLFYFMFSVTLYNLWVLLNTLLSLFLYGKLPEKPIITAKMFGTMFYMMETT